MTNDESATSNESSPNLPYKKKKTAIFREEAISALAGIQK